MSFISGEKLQALCDISWMTPEKKKFHSSFQGVYKMIHDIDSVDDGKILFVYGDLLDVWRKDILPRRTKPFVLVVHNSDEAIGESYKDVLDHPLLLHMFSQNTFLYHSKLTALPIGIANSQWNHGNQSNMQHMVSKSLSWEDKKNMVYTNINLSTNYHHRLRVLEELKYPFVFHAHPKPHLEYLVELSGYKWVLSPKGNGVDCHRLWESLYAGCIPLVDDTINARQFKEMGVPVIIVKDWGKLSLEELEKESYTYSSILELGYWEQKFNSY